MVSLWLVSLVKTILMPVRLANSAYVANEHKHLLLVSVLPADFFLEQVRSSYFNSKLIK